MTTLIPNLQISMKVLVGPNIVLDVLLDRNRFYGHMMSQEGSVRQIGTSG